MKRFTALFLAILMAASMTTFASATDEQISEVEQQPVLDFASVQRTSIDNSLEAMEDLGLQQVQPRNIDYLTFDDYTYSNGYAYFTVRPGIGEYLKLHIYLQHGGSLQFWVKEVGKYYWQPIEIIDDIGHNYRDLVYGTSGKAYELRVLADAAMYSGGVYSGN